MKYITYYSALLIVLALGLFACSDIKDDIPTRSSEIVVHEKGFADTTSANFHANLFKENNYNLPSRTARKRVILATAIFRMPIKLHRQKIWKETPRVRQEE